MLARAFLAMVAVAQLCTSCAAGVAGTPVADPTGPLTSREAFGDVSTVDFCSLLDQSNYPNVGTVVDRPSPSFSYCTLSVISNKTDASVLVGYLGTEENLRGLTLTPDRSLPRGLEMRKYQEDAMTCGRFLRFPDGVYLEVSATTFTSGGKTDWCPVVELTADRVVERLTARRVHHFAYGPNSLGRADACGLLDPVVVGKEAGTVLGDEVAFPGGHVCQWRLGLTGFVTVNFIMDDALTEFPTDETIAGRRTRIVADVTGLPECTLVTSHGFAPERAGDELVNLVVLLPDKGKDACAVARALAGHAWQKLP